MGEKLPRPVGERERRERIERLENVALAGDQRAAESGIEEIFLDDAPADDLLGVAVSRCGDTAAA